LTEKLFNALANLIAFGVETVNFFLQSPDQIALLGELSIEICDAMFGGGASLALALDKAHRTGDPVFQSGKIGTAECEIALFVVIHFRVLDGFRDLGFQR